MNSILIWLQLLDSHGITSLCHILPKSVTYVVVLFCNLSHGDVPWNSVSCTRTTGLSPLKRCGTYCLLALLSRASLSPMACMGSMNAEARTEHTKGPRFIVFRRWLFRCHVTRIREVMHLFFLSPAANESRFCTPDLTECPYFSYSYLLTPMLTHLAGESSTKKTVESADFLINRRSRRAFCCAFPAFLLQME